MNKRAALEKSEKQHETSFSESINILYLYVGILERAAAEKGIQCKKEVS